MPFVQTVPVFVFMKVPDVIHWPVIRELLLSGTCRPSAVRGVTIHEPDGGEG